MDARTTTVLYIIGTSKPHDAIADIEEDVTAENESHCQVVI